MLDEPPAQPLRLHHDDPQVTIWHGDALDALAVMADQSVDAIVCGPPYGLEFGGAGWDTFRPGAARFRSRVDGRTNPAVEREAAYLPLIDERLQRPLQAVLDLGTLG